MNKRSTIIVPSDSKFMEDKEINDRVYIWFILYGTYRRDGIYMNRYRNKGAKEIGINERTFKKRLNKLIECKYIEEHSDKEYRIPFKNNQYIRYIYRDTAEILFNEETDNIIKTYIWLGSYYDNYKEKATFTHSGILKGIGLSYLHNTHNQEKMKDIIKKLSNIGILKYSKEYDERSGYYRYRIKEVRK